MPCVVVSGTTKKWSKGRVAVGWKKYIQVRGHISVHWSLSCPPSHQGNYLHIWEVKWTKWTVLKEKCVLNGKERKYKMHEENNQHFIINDVLWIESQWCSRQFSWRQMYRVGRK